jgi:hypothetical protein
VAPVNAGERALEGEIKGLRTPKVYLEAASARPAARDLPDSASGRRRPSRTSRTCRPKEGAAGQRSNESSPEASDHSYRVQRHLRVKMMVVRVGRRAPYLGAAREEQP